jgi:phage antirepressor YoqD-like protein
MGLFDGLKKKQAELDKYSNDSYLKADQSAVEKVDAMLKEVESTVSEIKAQEATLKAEKDLAEAIRYNRHLFSVDPVSTYAEFKATLAGFFKQRAETRSLEDIQAEQIAIDKFKERHLRSKLNELANELRAIRAVQEPKVRFLEDNYEDAENSADITEFYNKIVIDFNSLLRRYSAIATFAPQYYNDFSRLKIERKTIATKKEEILHRADVERRHAQQLHDAFSDQR